MSKLVHSSVAALLGSEAITHFAHEAVRIVVETNAEASYTKGITIKNAASYREVIGVLNKMLEHAYPSVPVEQFAVADILPAMGSFKINDDKMFERAKRNVFDRLHAGWKNIHIDLSPIVQGNSAHPTMVQVNRSAYRGTELYGDIKYLSSALLNTLGYANYTVSRRFNPTTKRYQIVIDL